MGHEIGAHEIGALEPGIPEPAVPAIRGGLGPVPEPRPAGDFLRDILQQAGRSKSRSAYNRALDEALAPHLRDHCQIVGCRGGRLVVEVDAAPLYAELSGFRREELRQRINQLVPELPIAQLTFRLGGTGHV